ncbi:SDR family NAD(P)-dependent oxidoreductase [Nodularia sp. LEGE 04288]|uniref:SDR family oxidoreductase n=1 Tax=Nodularia sp. LEGE 04288 TaxID=1828639 RepID=UPI001D124AE5|nr:SDR family NAD(P)-dependent oxidoreductase [Nodularia sp. LEGE 04288]MCC2693883.1 SDR family NAD(P)-dependent oxidoreductase [Nodularia sp. LEGE 04288]
MTKLILITGISKGLGYAMTQGFIQQGHTVIGCARSSAAIEKLRQQFTAPNDFTVVDVKKEPQVETWAKDVLSKYDSPDILINNAAITNYPAPLWQVPSDEFSELIDINIKGVVNIIRHFVPAMVKNQRGIIVNFSSGWGRSTSPEVAPYCASKWAIEGLTRSLAQELPAGMAAVPLNPGIIYTDMLSISFGEEAANYTPVSDWVLKAVPYILKLKPTDNGMPLTVSM